MTHEHRFHFLPNAFHFTKKDYEEYRARLLNSEDPLIQSLAERNFPFYATILPDKVSCDWYDPRIRGREANLGRKSPDKPYILHIGSSGESSDECDFARNAVRNGCSGAYLLSVINYRYAMDILETGLIDAFADRRLPFHKCLAPVMYKLHQEGKAPKGCVHGMMFDIQFE